MDAAAPQHEQADHGAGKCCTHTGSGHAEPGDQQRIEDDVEDTHGRVQNAWRKHIPAALQKCGADGDQL